MTFIEAFFRQSFPPVGVLIILGIGMFFSVRKNTQREELLFFTVIVLGICVLWRFPLVEYSRRHAAPVVIPGLVLAGYCLTRLPGWLRERYRFKYSTAAARLLLAAVVLAGIGKALRFQEPKPYLKELPAALDADLRDNAVTGRTPLLLILGRPGGDWTLSPKLDVRNLREETQQEGRCIDVEPVIAYFREYGLFEFLTGSYPLIYIFCVEREADELFRAIRANFNRELQLIYEFVRAKDKTRYRLYRLKSPVNPGIPLED